MMVWMRTLADWASQPSLEIALASSAPLAGRLAFALVFAALIAWLLWCHRKDCKAVPTNQTKVSHRSINCVRYGAIAIATIQLLLYLFWS